MVIDHCVSVCVPAFDNLVPLRTTIKSPFRVNFREKPGSRVVNTNRTSPSVRLIYMTKIVCTSKECERWILTRLNCHSSASTSESRKYGKRSRTRDETTNNATSDDEATNDSLERLEPSLYLRVKQRLRTKQRKALVCRQQLCAIGIVFQTEQDLALPASETSERRLDRHITYLRSIPTRLPQSSSAF